ncbi:MAG: hypothetical protein ING75_03780 [Rhodocyclaceae bacterium]|nr:hypothetical protein [Rhodocyclaceae bacterium]
MIPYTVHFRAGEEEALNIIRTVSYETKGRDVMVTYADGLSKGLTIRYTKLSPNVARASIVTFRRVGP